MKIAESLCFDDVLLVPQHSDVMSRKEVDLSYELGDETFTLPIISSPMDTVTETEMARAMHKAGGFGIIHRYNSIRGQVNIVQNLVDSKKNFANYCINYGAAVGVSGDYLERAQELYKWGCRIFCVDIAHGHHELMKKALLSLRQELGDDVSLIAGNVATKEGYEALADWGATCVRLGIGGGSICSTRIQTGHGMPTLQSVMECSNSDRDALIIADGGIRNSGDIVKVLAAGADLVMVGSLLAGTDETPGEVIADSGGYRKVYRGMASADAQIDWRGHVSSLEGVSSLVPAKGPVSAVLEDLRRGICSGLSYSGCRTIPELQRKAKFIKQTRSGAVESSTHISAVGRVNGK
jgi:IMP dehydrogenase